MNYLYKLDIYIYISILNYLNINDLKSILSIDFKNKKYINELLIFKSSKIIKTFIKRTSYILKNLNEYNNILYYDNRISCKYIALYYIKHYTKDNIIRFYNIQILWKKKIIDKYKLEYKLKFTDNPSKYDFFNLIKRMELNDIVTIGW
jgi:hypothetical protein